MMKHGRPHRSVAQPGSAPDLGSGGQRFESSRSDQFYEDSAAAAEAVASVLTPDLLKPEWRAEAERSGNPVAGHCYAAAEAVYHLCGGAEAGWVPQVLTHATFPDELAPGQTHWFLKNRITGELVDPTQGQFDSAPPYGLGRGTGFLTAGPSRRAAVIIERVLAMDAVARPSLPGM